MTGQAPAFVASLGTEKDRGQWWVADDRLRSLAGDDGLSGTATIRAPAMRLR